MSTLIVRDANNQLLEIKVSDDPPASSVNLADLSILNATGASQPLLAAGNSRKVLTIINPIGGVEWGINPVGTVAVIGTPPTFRLFAGDTWSPRPCPRNAINGIAAAAGAKLIVLEG